MLQKLFVKFIATFGYSGLAPKAPGTCGSLAAIVLAYFLPQLFSQFSGYPKNYESFYKFKATSCVDVRRL